MAAHYGGAPVDDRPLGELFSEMTSQVQDLLRKEVELAKLETKEEMAKATKAGALLAAAGVAGFFAALLLAFAAAWGLAEAIPTGLAFLAVGLLFAVLGGLMLSAGRKKLTSVRPVPEQTLKTLRDDVAVAKGSLSRGASTTPLRPMVRSWHG